tara:strand:- start:2897 stop:3010 length:114 start_codon:yes stop_codon:yes gene_type:complete
VKPWSKHEAQSDFGGIVALFLQQCRQNHYAGLLFHLT